MQVSFDPANTHLRESLSQPPRKPKNADRRIREFLTAAEVQSLIVAAEKLGWHGLGMQRIFAPFFPNRPPLARRPVYLSPDLPLAQ